MTAILFAALATNKAAAVRPPNTCHEDYQN